MPKMHFLLAQCPSVYPKGSHKTFECSGPCNAQINCSEYLSLPDHLLWRCLNIFCCCTRLVVLGWPNLNCTLSYRISLACKPALTKLNLHQSAFCIDFFDAEMKIPETLLQALSSFPFLPPTPKRACLQASVSPAVSLVYNPSSASLLFLEGEIAADSLESNLQLTTIIEGINCTKRAYITFLAKLQTQNLPSFSMHCGFCVLNVLNVDPF